MPTLILRFPGGRYHATPFGHHVNEGMVEWPPSPWRILRALIACGYSKLGWSQIPPVGRRLLETLAGVLPTYRLPRASIGHSRHYMPTAVLEGARENTTLVFDTWADVADGAITVRWSCVLGEDERALLGQLVSHLGYLGRSESWVSAEIASDGAALPPGDEAWPHEHGPIQDGLEQVALLAPEFPQVYLAWREHAVGQALLEWPLAEGTKISKRVLEARARAVAPYPADLIDCLQRDTAWWKAQRWSQPPGSRRVLYCRRSDSLAVRSALPPRRRSSRRVPAMLLALATPSGNQSALPPRRRTLNQAELIHDALVSKVGRGRLVDCPEITGKDAYGRPLKGHRHSHCLPLDLDGDGHLDHVLVYAAMGLGSDAQDAVRSLRRTWTKGASNLRVALVGQGSLEDLRGLPDALRARMTELLGPSGGARTWTSQTPFVPPRYMKPRGKNTLAEQIKAEVASRGLPVATAEVLPWDDGTYALRHFARVRRQIPPPADVGFAIRLRFEAPVSGPLALGYGCHFGLGLFRSEPSLDPTGP